MSIVVQPAIAASSSSVGGEVGNAASAEADLAAAGVGCREHALGDALDGHGTARRTVSYTHIWPGNWMAGPGRADPAAQHTPSRRHAGALPVLGSNEYSCRLTHRSPC